MSKVKKRYSESEKLEIMEDMFLKKSEPFTKPELKKIGPAYHTAIKWGDIEKNLEFLLSEDRIEADKIGASILYWAFPSKKSNRLKRKRDQLQEQVVELKEKRRKLMEDIETFKVGKDESTERSNLELMRTQLEKKCAEDRKLIENYKNSDPNFIAEIQEATETAKESVERWTDNIFQTQSYWKKKLFKPMKEYYAIFKWIPQELE